MPTISNAAPPASTITVQTTNRVPTSNTPTTSAQAPQSGVPANDASRQTNNISETASPDLGGVNKEDNQSLKYRELSQQQVAFARREKEIRARQAALAEEKANIEKMKSSYDQDYIPKSKLKSDFMNVVTNAGLTADEIASMLLNPQPGQNPDVLEIRREIQALKDEQSKAQEAFKETQDRAYQQAVQQIQLEAIDVVKANPEFEAIRMEGKAGPLAVTKYIENYFNSTGRLMSVEQAAKEVEDHLIAEGMRYVNLSKIKSKFLPKQEDDLASAQSAQQQQRRQQQAQPQIRTLTNSGLPNATKPMTPRERAILAFKGQLK